MKKVLYLLLSFIFSNSGACDHDLFIDEAQNRLKVKISLPFACTDHLEKKDFVYDIAETAEDVCERALQEIEEARTAKGHSSEIDVDEIEKLLITSKSPIVDYIIRRALHMPLLELNIPEIEMSLFLVGRGKSFRKLPPVKVPAFSQSNTRLVLNIIEELAFYSGNPDYINNPKPFGGMQIVPERADGKVGNIQWLDVNDRDKIPIIKYMREIFYLRKETGFCEEKRELEDLEKHDTDSDDHSLEVDSGSTPPPSIIIPLEQLPSLNPSFINGDKYEGVEELPVHQASHNEDPVNRGSEGLSSRGNPDTVVANPREGGRLKIMKRYILTMQTSVITRPRSGRGDPEYPYNSKSSGSPRPLRVLAMTNPEKAFKYPIQSFLNSLPRGDSLEMSVFQDIHLPMETQRMGEKNYRDDRVLLNRSAAPQIQDQPNTMGFLAVTLVHGKAELDDIQCAPQWKNIKMDVYSSACVMSAFTFYNLYIYHRSTGLRLASRRYSRRKGHIGKIDFTPILRNATV